MQDTYADIVLAGIAGLSLAVIIGVEIAKRRLPRPRRFLRLR